MSVNAGRFISAPARNCASALPASSPKTKFLMLGRILTLLGYTALGILILTFIFSNRDIVNIHLLPLSLEIEMPLFLALSLVFVLGLLIGLSYAGLVALSRS